jgi:YidC/Oxa1 family membrane protein insertase
LKQSVWSRLLLLALALPLVLTACLPFSFSSEPFDLQPFTVIEFRDADRLRNACVAPAAASFWCDSLDAVMTRIPTKGIDYVINDAGEVVAAFAKFQRGQGLGSYQVENRDNLIASNARYPGGAILFDGVYYPPENPVATWTEVDGTTFHGRFTYTAGGFEVEVLLEVSNVVQTLHSEVVVRVPADSPADLELPALVQYVVAGVGRADPPTIKIGQGEASSLNPLTMPVANPTYISLQTANNNRDNAILLLPGRGFTGAGPGVPLAAVSLGEKRIALQAPWSDGVRLTVDAYYGKNELVRFYQEGYDDLPGLFTPNILGRLSLWVLIALETIYDQLNNWGLSIIVLTLLFRLLVWPLITTQTRSMFGMQALKPEMDKLQKKYKDDREKLTQETMKLYKEAGVNPAGGCLPILLQMPLFIILWRVFVNFEFNEGFLWLPDLGMPDPFYILPALYVAVMMGMSWFSARGNPMMMRQSMLINVVFVFIMVGFPAGVLLYFVVSMGVQVFQYWLLSRGKPAPAASKA